MKSDIIRKKINSLPTFLGHFFLRIGSKVYQPPQQIRVIPWFKDKGDQTLRLNYDLDANSLVFDVGGYEGQWASDIFSMYSCTIHLFEPVEQFAEQITRRFAKNRKIIVHKFGLSNENTNTLISVSGDGSSLFRRGNDVRYVRLIKTIDFIRENQIETIDLIKINIEGGEYDLLSHLIEVDYVKNIKDIQVQFHDFVSNAEQRMAVIQQQLAKTHFLTYQYPFVWENWRRKEA